MKVHLVDGTYELFRAYYGVPPAHDAAGRPVGALSARRAISRRGRAIAAALA